MLGGVICSFDLTRLSCFLFAIFFFVVIVVEFDIDRQQSACICPLGTSLTDTLLLPKLSHQGAYSKSLHTLQASRRIDVENSLLLSI
jgi:hypothetical protein